MNAGALKYRGRFSHLFFCGHTFQFIVGYPLRCAEMFYHLFREIMKFIALAGRIFFSLIFITSSFNHFKEAGIQYGASHGVIFPELLVPAAGVLALAGGLSIMLGYKTKPGAWMITAFLVPVTLIMHDFWAIEDTHESRIQRVMFMKNTCMLGGALLITYFGAGPLSVDAMKKS